MLQTVWYGLAIVMIVATVMPISSDRRWWVRGLDFPRLQLVSVQLVLAALYFPLASTVGGIGILVFAALLASLCYQLWWILPYTEFHAQELLGATAEQQRHGVPLTLLTSNVLMSNRDADRLIEQVHAHRPDVLSVLESDQWWQDRLDVLDDYPHRIAHPLDNRYGMHVYSRLPLDDAHVDFLVEDDIPSMHAWLTLPDGERVRFHVVHPTPPAPGENERSTERDVELLVLARHLADRSEPIIVTGDLNDVAWSRTTRLFRRVSGLLDARVGRGTFNTFSADYRLLRWPLDHFFMSSHFRVDDIRRLENIGSDHFPILIRVIYIGSSSQEGHLQADEADEELAEEILDSDAGQQAKAPALKDKSSLPDPK